MEESTTYQEIIEKGVAKGVEKGKQQGLKEGIRKGIKEGVKKGIAKGIAKGIEEGRASEIRSILFRLGAKQFGLPSQSLIERLEDIADVNRLEVMKDFLIDGVVKSWEQLLK